MGVEFTFNWRDSATDLSTSASVGLGVDAAAELQRVDLLASSANSITFSRKFSLVISRLMLEDPVVIIPERSGILLEDAAAGKRRRFRPGVNLLKRQGP